MLLGSLLNDGGVSRTIVWALHCLQSPMTICPLVSQPFSITGNCEDSEGSVGGCGTAGVCGGGSGGGGDVFVGLIVLVGVLVVRPLVEVLVVMV